MGQLEDVYFLIIGLSLCPQCERITEHIIAIIGEDETATYCQFICLDGCCNRMTNVIPCDKLWIRKLIQRYIKRLNEGGES